MPPNPPRNAQRLRRAQDMSSTCAGRLLLALHNFPVFSLLLSIMPEYVYKLYMKAYIIMLSRSTRMGVIHFCRVHVNCRVKVTQ